uniref:Charged multivesicular body protein 4b-like n=1 Tax=Callorhinchus milii TaxID=7868 RepID=A0A4W3GX77_CALMI
KALYKCNLVVVYHTLSLPVCVCVTLSHTFAHSPSCSLHQFLTLSVSLSLSLTHSLSSGKGTKAPTPQDAIQKLAETEGILVKKQEFLEQKVQQEIATARKHGTKNKRAALQALKRKKRYEQQLSQIDGTLSTLEFQREALENATTNTEVLKTMSEAAKAMKSAHQNMDIDKVDELMSDITEQQDLAQEISDAISRPVGFGDDVDEDDLMAELEEMEQEDLERDLLNVGEENVEDLSPEALPTVPGLCACV